MHLYCGWLKRYRMRNINTSPLSPPAWQLSIVLIILVFWQSARKAEVHTKAFCILSPYSMGGRAQPQCVGKPAIILMLHNSDYKKSNTVCTLPLAFSPFHKAFSCPYLICGISWVSIEKNIYLFTTIVWLLLLIKYVQKAEKIAKFYTHWKWARCSLT